MTYTARIVFAYARDNMLPFSGPLSTFNEVLPAWFRLRSAGRLNAAGWAGLLACCFWPSTSLKAPSTPLCVFLQTTNTPLAAVWAITVFNLVLGLPMLVSDVAFEVLISLSTIALFIIYVFPGTPFPDLAHCLPCRCALYAM